MRVLAGRAHDLPLEGRLGLSKCTVFGRATNTASAGHPPRHRMPYLPGRKRHLQGRCSRHRNVVFFACSVCIGLLCRCSCPHPVLCCPLGQFVAPLVEMMPGMAPQPFPGDLMFAGQRNKLLPEVLVDERIRGFQSTFADPAMDPLAHPPDQVLRIAEYAHRLRRWSGLPDPVIAAISSIRCEVAAVQNRSTPFHAPHSGGSRHNPRARRLFPSHRSRFRPRPAPAG